MDILDSRDPVAIRQERKYTNFSEESAFQKEFRHVHIKRSMHSNKCEIDSQASAWHALDVIDDFVDRDLEKQSAHYYQRKTLNDGIPDACLKISRKTNSKSERKIYSYRALYPRFCSVFFGIGNAYVAS